MTLTVVHVRGTCGSGKTTLVRAILADSRGDWRPSYHRERYAAAWNLQVLLHDGIPVRGQTIPAIWRAVLELGRHVLVEGIYHSNQKQCWLDLVIALRERGARYQDVYLSTSLAECERRVLARRAAINNQRPYDPKNMRGIFQNVQRRYQEMAVAGFAPERLPVDDPEGRVRALLNLPVKAVAT